MKRKIASLDVFVDTESKDSSATRKVGPDQYVITIRPSQTSGNGDDSFSLKTDRDLQTTLAHELGHFVALVTKDKTHDNTFQLYYQLTGDTSPLIPAEKLAWKLAHVIYPELDIDNERLAMDSYTKMAWGMFPDSKLVRKARCWEFGGLAVILALYWFAGLLVMGGGR